MNIVQVENVSKHFGEFKAVDDVSLHIEKGQPCMAYWAPTVPVKRPPSG